MSKKLSTSVRNRRIRQTKKEIKIETEPFCQVCRRNDSRLTMSHIISVDRCERIGKQPLTWAKLNMDLHCQKTHDTWEYQSWEEIFEHFRKYNATNKLFQYLDYIQKHDPEQYARAKIDLIEKPIDL